MIIKGKIADYEERHNDKGSYYVVRVEPENPLQLVGYARREPTVGLECVCSVKNGRIEDIEF